jgi:LysR family transcriptional regulator, nitrogen assimilation regulatory protein
VRLSIAQNAWLDHLGRDGSLTHHRCGDLLMDLRQLRYFLHVAGTQNLTQASGKAWISQSALSRQIQQLEAELGVVLFERQARGLKLTDAGHNLVRRAEALLHAADELSRAVCASQPVPSGTLRIGTPTSLRKMLLLPFLMQYQQRFPSVLVVHQQGTVTGMRNALAQGDLDLVISTPQTVGGFVLEPLLSEALCWVGPPQAGLAMDKTVALKRVLEQPLILTSAPNGLRLRLDTALQKLKLKSQPIIETDTADVMLDLAHQGVGYTVLPYSAAHEALAARAVSLGPIKALRFEWTLARSRERLHTVAAQEAAKLMHDICHAAVASGCWRTARVP